MEESDTSTHKVSDSGYSNSCNSQSQRSSGSSKSRHSNSSGSSGYGGHPSTLGSGNEVFPQPLTKRSKDKEHKKKKLKSAAITTVTAEHHVETSPISAAEGGAGCENVKSGIKSCGKVITKNIAKISNVCTSSIPANGVGPLCPENTTSLQPVLTTLGQSSTKDLLNALPDETEDHIDGCRDTDEPETTTNLRNDDVAHCPELENEFSTVVSLHDGVVMCTTSSITRILGFPKDMWVGRSFINFVHPKDREAFANHITTGISLQLEETKIKAKESYFCCLRQYRGLKSNGYGVTEKRVTYLPFQLTMTFKEISDVEKMGVSCEDIPIHGMFLIITASLMKSAYTYIDETKTSPKFVTKHLATCHISHVDPDVVTYLGYLPQDMLGHSIFEFYHPEDSLFLKEVYEGVIKEQGQPFKSKPYRFKVQNGGYVLLETEWSGFVNPWSRKLEFVMGQHRVIKGPSNPDVFTSLNEEDGMFVSEEVIKESKIIQEEIENLLKETIQRTTDILKQQVSKRCKDLATFMETLMSEVTKPDLKVELPTEEQSFSERDSVMLGEISPHHDYYDSKSSSETPPSYNQLNYNENIQRFFESKPKTTLSDESGESKIEANRSLNSTDEEGKSMPVADSSLDSSNRKCCSPVNGSGSGSGGSSGSAGMPTSAASRGDTSATNTSHGSYKPPHLTEALLCRHNEDMEKKMVQKHRESRAKGGDRENKKKLAYDKLHEQCHGVKRSVSHSWEGEPFKGSKHPHVETLLAPGNIPGPNPNVITAPVSSLYQSSPNINLWPPFSVTVTPLQSTQPCSAHNGYPSGTIGSTGPHLTSMIPVYYIPTGAQQTTVPTPGVAPQEHPGPPPVTANGMMIPGQPPYLPSQVPFMNPLPNMLYHPMPPMYGATPMMYSSVMLQPSTILPTPMSHSGFVASPHSTLKKSEKSHAETGMVNGVGPTSKFQRPASQATSVKAEPGSAMGSIASASIKRAMSECSKKEKSLCSPGAPMSSPANSPNNHKIKNSQEKSIGSREMENITADDSSYSSFYSFLRTDKSDESMNCSLAEKEFPFPYRAEDMAWDKCENKSTICQEKPRPVLKDPPWLEQVEVTPELIYRYQVGDRSLENILESDFEMLKKIQQPLLVNDQLSQLYLDLELEGLSTTLKLEEGLTSCSSGSSGEETHSETQNKKKRRGVEYGKLVMIFEENAPLPPPV